LKQVDEFRSEQEKDVPDSEESMMIITCPTCGHQGKVDPSRIPEQGAKAKCPKCQNGFLVQKPPKQPSAPTAAPPDAPVPATTGPEASAPLTTAPEPPPPSPATEPEQPQAPAQSPAPPLEAPLGFAGQGTATGEGAGEGLSLQAPPPQDAASKDVACTGCLKLFKEEEISRVGERNLCRSCQEAFQAKGQTPAPPTSTPSYGPGHKKPRFEYGGFWIRGGAYLVDGVFLALIMWFVTYPIFMKMFSGMFSSLPMMDPSTMDQAQIQAMMAEVTGKMMRAVWITNLLNMIFFGGYFIVLEGGPGQTLGKKALGLRVVTPDGERIGYLKAFARYIGKIISGVILGIGFIMAAFDNEKRALHDRMCDSRVVRV
jgi:predicted Zn finger-like uncharacterized protein